MVIETTTKKTVVLVASCTSNFEPSRGPCGHHEGAYVSKVAIWVLRLSFRAILRDHKEDGFKSRERSHSPIAHLIPQRSSKTRFSELAVSHREPHRCSSHRKWKDSAENPGRLAALGRHAGPFGALHCTAIPTASFPLRLMLPTPIKMTSRIDQSQ
jgi:hypothetical protein